MQDFINDLRFLQKELLTEFLSDTFDVPATRKGLASLTSQQKYQDHQWNAYQVRFHGNGIRFVSATNRKTIDFDFGIYEEPVYASICPYRAWVYLKSLDEEKQAAYGLPESEPEFQAELQRFLEAK